MDETSLAIYSKLLQPELNQRLRFYCRFLERRLLLPCHITDDERQASVIVIHLDELKARQVTFEPEAEGPLTVALCKAGSDASLFDGVLRLPLSADSFVVTFNRLARRHPQRMAMLHARRKSVDPNQWPSKVQRQQYLRDHLHRRRRFDDVSVERRASDRGQWLITLARQLKAKNLFNLVLLGSPAAGKTTLVVNAQVSSAQGVISCEQASDDVYSQGRSHTTVGIDCLRLGDEFNNLRISANPGLLRLGFVWPLTVQCADALLILLDLRNPDPVAEFEFQMALIRDRNRRFCLIYCAFTHCDESDISIDALAKTLTRRSDKAVRLFPLDVRERSQVEKLLAIITNDLQRQRNQIVRGEAVCELA